MALFDGSNTKAIFAALGAAAAAVVVALEDGVFTGTEIGEIVAVLLAAGGITWLAPFANYLKPIAATVTSVLGALVIAIENGGGIVSDEWYAIAAIVFTAIGTYSFPNAKRSTVT